MKIQGRNFILNAGYLPRYYAFGVELMWGYRLDAGEGESRFDDVKLWRIVDAYTLRRWGF